MLPATYVPATQFVEVITAPNGARLPLMPESQLKVLPPTKLREHAQILAQAFSHKSIRPPLPGVSDQDIVNWILLNQRAHLEPLRQPPPPQSPKMLAQRPGWSQNGSVLAPPSSQPQELIAAPLGQSPVRWSGPQGGAVVRTASPTPVATTPLLIPGRSPVPGLRPVSVNIVSVPQIPVQAPSNILSRIDGVVAEMERELNEDLHSINTPRGGKDSLGNRAEHESTMDWLDKQIQSIESRRDICEKRQEHLNDLRSLVRDGHRRWTPDGIKSLLSEEEEVLGRPKLTPRGRSRLSLLETEHLNLRQQVHDLVNEQQNDELAASYFSLAEALEKEKARGDILQDRLIEAEAAYEREHRLGLEIEEARGSAEADLRALEENSRSVLQDCRFLQTRLRELESGFDGERQQWHSRLEGLKHYENGHHPRVAELEKVLENMRSEHDEHRLRLEGEHHGHRSRIAELEELLRGHDTSHSEKDRRLRELEDIISGHTDRHSEKDERLRELLETVTNHQSDRDHHRTRAEELEELLKSHQADSHHHRTRLEELEDLLGNHEADAHRHRTRAEELEELLGNHQARHKTLEEELFGWKNKHDTHQTRLAELAQELEDVMNERDGHVRDKQGHKQKLTELELLIADLQAGHDGHIRTHGQNKQKITDLELFIEELQEKHAQTHSSHKGRISELELEIERLLDNDSNSAKQLGMHKSKVSDLESRIKEHEDEIDGHKRQHQTHRQKIKELEEALLNAELQQGSKQPSAHLSKIQELEQMLLEKDIAESGHKQKHSKHEAHIKDLEQQLLDAMNDVTGHKQKHSRYELSIKELNARIEELTGGEETHLQKHREHQKKYSDLEQLLQDEQAAKRALELNHQALRNQIEDMEELRRENARLKEIVSLAEQERTRLESDVRNLQNQLQQEHRRASLLRSEKKETENLEKLHQEQLQRAEEKLKELERERQKDKRSRSVLVTPTQRNSAAKGMRFSSADVLKRQSYLTRSSLFGEHVRKGLLGGEFLPGNTDPFVEKIRSACRVVGEALASATGVHIMAVEKQLNAMVAARSANSRNVIDALQDYTERAVVQSEQKAARSNVEAAIHDLKALRQELETHHQLSEREKEEIRSRLQLDLEKCDIEMRLLDSPSSISELPAALVMDLLDVHSNARVDLSKSYDNGMSPMHQAAKLGRRDLIEYLLEKEDGIELLGKADHRGRTPLFYAEQSSRPLFHWLRETKNFMSPLHTQEQRPDVRNVPATHLKLLSSIESQGWQSVSWKNGHTMLHWAAQRGDDYLDLVRYLLTLQADPNAKDSQGRTALLCAREKHHHQVAAFLAGVTNT